MKKASLAQFGKILDVYGTPRKRKQFYALQLLQQLKDLTLQYIKKKCNLPKKEHKDVRAGRDHIKNGLTAAEIFTTS